VLEFVCARKFDERRFHLRIVTEQHGIRWIIGQVRSDFARTNEVKLGAFVRWNQMRQPPRKLAGGELWIHVESGLLREQRIKGQDATHAGQIRPDL
jgi:hypothetical protein